MHSQSECWISRDSPTELQSLGSTSSWGGSRLGAVLAEQSLIQFACCYWSSTTYLQLLLSSLSSAQMYMCSMVVLKGSFLPYLMSCFSLLQATDMSRTTREEFTHNPTRSFYEWQYILMAVGHKLESPYHMHCCCWQVFIIHHRKRKRHTFIACIHFCLWKCVHGFIHDHLIKETDE